VLIVLAFLDTVCTRVGISQGHNQGKQKRKTEAFGSRPSNNARLVCVIEERERKSVQ
jgi:hypothetical protein